ncbi:MAG TPA: prolipoprotein diacylglyceryl transferase family protein [Candidatus Eisenbacteria bacterium]|nr:prolipoprotein diacylglyceryl transferase family protein [Candidatus Eisenbacteria bacterium]
MFGTIVIDLDPNIGQIGPFLITWHGVFSVIGILAAARVGQVLLQRDGIAPERVYDMAIWMVVAGLIGARLLFVWENYQVFAGNWVKVVQINEGGISQWGGIFGGLLGGYLWCWRNRIDYRQVLDAVGPATALGFAIGRIGDVINGEHHAIDTNLPWGVTYVNARTLGEVGRTVHPEVAYELVFNLAVFGTAMLTYRWFKRRLPVGVTGLIWLSVYAAGRFLLSYLRKDSLALGLRQAQWASLAMIVAAAIAIALWTFWRGRRSPTSSQQSEQEPAAV